eukprot:CAMPEP_0180628066 /NCGR_PEP_ID=MMETSP1037_2-20121125/38722_1 /TAXON_ID=632150 /ORGANISM="Azadinium spinosum, Strain 3D9" /LENGTH=217 /DNA_ID=CAMNT_0022648761 /DNA_START=308 /DNA_END=957 /DNA_ORIENTATION=+
MLACERQAHHDVATVVHDMRSGGMQGPHKLAPLSENIEGPGVQRHEDVQGHLLLPPAAPPPCLIEKRLLKSMHRPDLAIVGHHHSNNAQQLLGIHLKLLAVAGRVRHMATRAAKEAALGLVQPVARRDLDRPRVDRSNPAPQMVPAVRIGPLRPGRLQGFVPRNRLRAKAVENLRVAARSPSPLLLLRKEAAHVKARGRAYVSLYPARAAAADFHRR